MTLESWQFFSLPVIARFSSALLAIFLSLIDVIRDVVFYKAPHVLDGFLFSLLPGCLSSFSPFLATLSQSDMQFLAILVYFRLWVLTRFAQVCLNRHFPLEA